MGWPGPILTDSGGFQTLSLGRLNSLSEEGVIFRSHIDGRKQFLSPELAVEYQEQLGVDIAMVLDHCPPYGAEEPDLREATVRTHQWALRCRKAHRLDEQALFAVVQGGVRPGASPGVGGGAGGHGLRRIRAGRSKRR